MVPERLGVIGLGGEGGAVALRAARTGVPHILGFDDSTKQGVAAVRAGAVTELVHDPGSVIRRSEFVVLAGSLRRSVKLLEAHRDEIAAGSAVVTDIARLKRPIVAAAERLALESQFAGSHLALDASGAAFESVSPDVLEGALVYVTPAAGGERAVAEVADFWMRVVGAHPVTVGAERHDQVIAWTEHLPRAAAAVVGLALAHHGPTGVTYGAPAVDLTRLALRDPEDCARDLLNNRDNVLTALEGLEATTADLRRALETGDVRAVREWLAGAADWRRRLGR